MAKVTEEFVVVGVNYRKAALDIRNKFAFTTENIRQIYESDGGILPSNFFILSTCNRTEIYGINTQPDELINLFATHGHAGKQESYDYTYTKTGQKAIQHLFKVASGLDSQILGDYEIIGQLKNAFALSKSYKCAGGLLEKLVNSALQASREVRNLTSISDGTTSVSYAVIQLLKKEVAVGKTMNVSLMGLGKIGTLTLKNLKHYLPQHNITVVNRNEVKGQLMAEQFGVKFVKFEEQEKTLADCNVLIVATGADHPIITASEILDTGIKLLFDLSVPSNVSADVKNLSNLKFYDIDSLSEIVNNTLSKRKSEIPFAEQIIEKHITELAEWEKRRSVYKLKEAK